MDVFKKMPRRCVCFPMPKRSFPYPETYVFPRRNVGLSYGKRKQCFDNRIFSPRDFYLILFPWKLTERKRPLQGVHFPCSGLLPLIIIIS